MDGWGKLGAAMFGGPDIEGARMQGQDAAASLANKLYDADLKRLQRMKNEREMAARMKAQELSGDPMLSAMFGAGIDPRQLSGYRQGMQEVDQGSEIWNMMQGGASMDDLNRALMVAKGDPIQLQRNLGSGVFSPNAYDSRTAPVVSDVGRSMIAKNNAQAAASHALANQRNNPAAAPGRNPMNWTNPAGDIVDRMFGEQMDGGVYMADPTKVAAFEAWRQQNLAADPRLADGDYALSRWMVEQNKAATPGVEQNAPTIGEIVDGYRYSGGNPADPASWEPL